MLKIFKYKELLIELVKREIKARYKQSILGYAWVLLVPLLNLTVMSIVFSYFIRIPTGDTPYVIFLFTGLVPWMFTANAIAFATSSLVDNSSLITKIKLPTEIFPLASILSKMVDFLLTLIIFFLFIFIYRIPLQLTILFLPLVFLIQFILVVGISLVLSAINVYYRDVQNMIGVFITLWMYLTPVIYPQELIPQTFIPIFNLNPMMPIINAYRNIILYGVTPSWQSFIYSVVLSIIIFIFGYSFFKRRSRYFADVI